MFLAFNLHSLSHGPDPVEGSEIKVQWRETLAPGEAVLERSTSMWVMKMASVLFGNFQGLKLVTFRLAPFDEHIGDGAKVGCP
jgi:hypothetical protein